MLALGCASGADPASQDTESASSGDNAAVAQTSTPDEPAPAAVPQGRERALRAEALDAVLAGKTHRGAVGPDRYALFFAADGATRGRMGETELTGRWTREGPDTFCIEWQSPPLPRGCTYIVWPRGEDATAYDASTGELRNTIDELVDGERTEL